VKTIDDFVTIVRDQVGLDVTVDTTRLAFDEVPGWDSVHLLGLMAAMETDTGRSVPLPDLLEAPSLEGIYELYAVS
jgi:acyl carrier protein